MTLGRSFATLLFALFSAPAAATLLDWDGDQTFDGSFDGEFGVANNWNPDQIPVVGDMANFDADATYTVTLAADGAADEVRVVAGHAMLLSDSPTVRTLNITTGNMDGNVSGGELTIGSATNPVVVNIGDIMNIGSNATGANTVTVSGAMSALNALASTTHNVGRNSLVGKLFVDDDATVTYGGTLRVGVDNNSVGQVQASAGGQIHTGHIEVATSGTGGAGHLESFDGGSWFQQTLPGATLTVGSADGKFARLEMRNGGKITTGTGLTTVNATAEVLVGFIGDATFDVLGDLDLVGGRLVVFDDAGDVFDFGSGQTLTASAGGRLAIAQAYEISGTIDIRDNTTLFENYGPLTMAATGTLSIDGGRVVARAGFDETGGTLDLKRGTLTVLGGALVLDESEPGHVNVIEGNADGYASVFLGEGGTANLSRPLRVGENFNGSVTLTEGATLSSTGRLGIEAGANGNVLVSGTDSEGNPSTWTVTQDGLTIGEQGKGYVTIRDGAQVTSGSATVAMAIDAVGLVYVLGTDEAGNPSSWTSSSNLDIGLSGRGYLTIAEGAHVTNVSAIIAGADDSQGIVDVTGAGSQWTNLGDLGVGGTDFNEGGDADLLISDSAMVQVDGTLTIWEPGVVSLDGGTLKINSDSVVNYGILDYITGTFHLTDVGGYTVGANSGPIDQVLGLDQVALPNGGGLIVDETLTVPASNSLTAVVGEVTADGLVNDGLVNLNQTTLTTSTGVVNNGDVVLINSTVEGPFDNAPGSNVTVLGNVDFNGPVTGPGNFYGPGTANFNGGMAPGASPVEVTFEGSVSLADTNTLFIEIGGLTSGSQYDRLVVDGNALIDGVLDVSLIDEFAPTPGQQFTILTASNLVDNGLVLGGSAAGLFNLLVDNSSVTLLAVTGLAGDYNQNGIVDAADYTLWRDNFGSGTSLPNDDTPGVGQDDYDRWKAHFGTSVGSGSGTGASASVPETAGFVLLIIALAASAAGKPFRPARWRSTMLSPRTLYVRVAFLLQIAIAVSNSARGDDFTWGTVLDSDWDNSRNWKHEDNLADGVGGPNGFDDGEIPDDSGDTAIVGAATSDPILDQNRLIGNLIVDVGGQLFTGSGNSNFQLRVAGITDIGDSNKGILTVRNSPSSVDFNTDFLNIFEDGTVELVDGADDRRPALGRRRWRNDFRRGHRRDDGDQCV